MLGRPSYGPLEIKPGLRPMYVQTRLNIRTCILAHVNSMVLLEHGPLGGIPLAGGVPDLSNPHGDQYFVWLLTTHSLGARI